MFVTFLKDLHYAFIGLGLVSNCTVYGAVSYTHLTLPTNREVYGVLIEIFLNGLHL